MQAACPRDQVSAGLSSLALFAPGMIRPVIEKWPVDTLLDITADTDPDLPLFHPTLANVHNGERPDGFRLQAPASECVDRRRM
jgi:hypothetical protein